MSKEEVILSQIEHLISEYHQKTVEKRTKRIPLSEPSFDEHESIRAVRTILGGWISQGPNVKEFEQKFAAYCGCLSGIAVNSGSSANLLALLSLKNVYNLKDGDEVLIPASTFATVAMPIIQAGLVPVYVDVSLKTLNIDPSKIEEAISERTKILMPVHTLGYPAPMNELMKIANRHQFLVLEDCCEAHGSSIDGKKVGSFGDIATFSFFVAHNITTGEGGMVVTNNERLESHCRSLREFGRIDQANLSGEDRFYSDDYLIDYDKRYVFDNLGYNLRMTDIAAAFGIEQLKKLDSLNQKRRENATLLKKCIKAISGDFFALAEEESGYFHTYYTFPILLNEEFLFTRKDFVQYLEQEGIETRPLFAGCLPDQPGLRNQPGRIAGNLKNSRFLRDRMIFVGIHPGLEKQDVEYIAEKISSFVFAKR